jgi:N-acetylmuramoyl-L-alanine amidase
MSIRRLIAVLALLASAAVPAHAAGPKTRYERVLAQESTLRLQSPRPSPLSQIRKIVSAYEYVARRHPTSGYADNALLQGAELSMTAHRLYGSEMDRTSAQRMLQWLIDQYPHSSLLVKARQMLSRAKPADKVARSRAGASPIEMAAPSMRESVGGSAAPIAPRPATSASALTSSSASRVEAGSAAMTAAVPPATTAATTTGNVLIKQVTRTEFPDMVRVTVEFDGLPDYRQERLEGPARLYFDMKNTQAAPWLQDTVLSYDTESVRHIRLGRPKQDMTRLVIDLAGVEKYNIFALQNPYRLTIDLQRSVPLLTPMTTVKPAPDLSRAKTSLARGATGDAIGGATGGNAAHADSAPARHDVTKASSSPQVASPQVASAATTLAPASMTAGKVAAGSLAAGTMAPKTVAKGASAFAPPPIATRGVASYASDAPPEVVGSNVAHDIEPQRIPPRPLPHPLSDTPRVTQSRAVTSELARMRRVKPIVASHYGFPGSAPLALVPATTFTGNLAAMLIPPPLAASRLGLPLNTRTTRAPKPTAVASRVDAAARAETARREAAGINEEELADARDAATERALSTKTPLPNRSAGPSTLPAPTAPSANATGGFSLARQLGLGVARIVIDPGHGGHDPGALGSTKIIEKDIVLDVALRLEKLLLNEPGFQVLLTRRTDIFIPLEERTAIANREQADLFLSIHANSSRNRTATGVETYYLNFASNPEAEAVAARENAGASQTMNHLPEIVKAIALNNKLDESRDFARMVQTAMVARLRAQNAAMRDLGVKQAPFVVLIGAGMPSVLAEIAFLSNQQEGGLLKTNAYRQKVAEALFEAVKSYQRSLKSVGTVANGVGFILPNTDRN